MQNVLTLFTDDNLYDTNILPIVGKIIDVKRIPIQATVLSALLIMVFFPVAGVVLGNHLFAYLMLDIHYL